MSDVKLGFSTGRIRELVGMWGALTVLRDLGCRGVEIGLRDPGRIVDEEIDQIAANDVKKFDYVSIHAPAIDYGEDSAMVLEHIERFNKIRPLDLVVFHPDKISDFSVLGKVSFKVGIENMDHQKKSCRSVADLKRILDAFPRFGLVLDVNHIFANDRTMQLADEFHDALGDRIVQYHVSGFGDDVALHVPLFETQQIEIIRAVRNKSVPIIVESPLAPETVTRERDYILENL